MSFEDVARMISNKIASYEQSSRQREELTKSMDKDVADIKILFQSLCSSVVAMKVPSGSDVLNLPIVCSGQQLTKIEFQKRIECRLSLPYLQTSLSEYFPLLEKSRTQFLLPLFSVKYDLGQSRDPCLNFLPFLSEGLE